MSEKIDKFCDDLKSKLYYVDSQLTEITDKMEEFRHQSQEAIQNQLDKAKDNLDKQRRKVESTHLKMRHYLEEKKLETDTKIEQWKRNQEVKKLERRADNAEEYAAMAVYAALAAVNEAEAATLEAVACRQDFEHVEELRKSS